MIMTEAVDTSGNTRDLINGKKVESRTTATAPSLLDKNKKTLVNGVDEVLLADGSIVYQCVRSRHCFRDFETVKSATSHLRSHGRPQAAARRDAEIDREQQQREQQSAAGKRGHELRRERAALLIADESRIAWLLGLADELEKAVPMLRELAKLKAPCEPTISNEELAELAAKASKYDAMRGLLA